MKSHPVTAGLLFIVVGGCVMAYMFLVHPGVSDGKSVREIWRGLSLTMRLPAVAGLVASAWGLGLVLGGLGRRKPRQP